MSDSKSYSGSDCDSEFNYIPGEPKFLQNHQEEVEDLDGQTTKTTEREQELDEILPYSDEPLADQDWLKDYNKQRQLEEELRRKLQQRIDGVDSWESWQVKFYLRSFFHTFDL